MSEEVGTSVRGDKQECQEVYKSVRRYTRVSGGIQECQKVYKSVRRYVRVSGGIQECQEVYKSVRRYKRESEGIQQCLEVYKSQKVYNSVWRYTRVSGGVYKRVRRYTTPGFALRPQFTTLSIQRWTPTIIPLPNTFPFLLSACSSVNERERDVTMTS